MKFIDKLVHGIVTHKTEIFMVGSVALGVGCVVTAAVQTVKACDIITDANDKLDSIEKNVTDEEEREKMCKDVRKHTNIALVKTYIVPATLGAGAIVCEFAAYKIMKGREAALVAALSASTAALEKYRARVRERFGDDVDYEIYNGVKYETSKDEDGNTVITTTYDPIDSNCYTKIFSYETSGEWTSNRRHNIEKLKFYERYWNEQLRIKGYVTYNEVIESLGISRRVGDGMTEKFIPNGIGWVSTENIPDELAGQFDTYIGFAPTYVDYSDEPADLVYEDAYVLRFNCYPIDGLLSKKSEAVCNGAH